MMMTAVAKTMGQSHCQRRAGKHCVIEGDVGKGAGGQGGEGNGNRSRLARTIPHLHLRLP